MSALKELVEVSRKLEELLNGPVTSKNREMVIEQINLFIDQRSRLMKEINPPFTDEEKLLGKEIVAMNERIQVMMTDVLNVLKVEMKELKKQKKSNQNYVNPYKDVRTNDGMFMDSKK